MRRCDERYAGSTEFEAESGVALLLFALCADNCTLNPVDTVEGCSVQQEQETDEAEYDHHDELRGNGLVNLLAPP